MHRHPAAKKALGLPTGQVEGQPRSLSPWQPRSCLTMLLPRARPARQSAILNRLSSLSKLPGCLLTCLWRGCEFLSAGTCSYEQRQSLLRVAIYEVCRESSDGLPGTAPVQPHYGPHKLHCGRPCTLTALCSVGMSCVTDCSVSSSDQIYRAKNSI